MAFTKDSWQREMFSELYSLAQKWWTLPHDRLNDDAMWDELITEADDFCKKYSQESDRIAVMFALAILRHAEDQAKHKGILCEPTDSSELAAVFRHFEAQRKE